MKAPATALSAAAGPSSDQLQAAASTSSSGPASSVPSNHPQLPQASWAPNKKLLIRSSMFYHMPNVLKAGLPAKHILGSFPASNAGAEALTRVIFGLSDPKKSGQKGRSRLTKQLQQVQKILKRLIRNHQKCDYKRLLEQSCPIPAVVADQLPHGGRGPTYAVRSDGPTSEVVEPPTASTKSATALVPMTEGPGAPVGRPQTNMWAGVSPLSAPSNSDRRGTGSQPFQEMPEALPSQPPEVNSRDTLSVLLSLASPPSSGSQCSPATAETADSQPITTTPTSMPRSSMATPSSSPLGSARPEPRQASENRPPGQLPTNTPSSSLDEPLSSASHASSVMPTNLLAAQSSSLSSLPPLEHGTMMVLSHQSIIQPTEHPYTPCIRTLQDHEPIEHLRSPQPSQSSNAQQKHVWMCSLANYSCLLLSCCAQPARQLPRSPLVIPRDLPASRPCPQPDLRLLNLTCCRHCRSVFLVNHLKAPRVVDLLLTSYRPLIQTLLLRPPTPQRFPASHLLRWPSNRTACLVLPLPLVHRNDEHQMTLTALTVHNLWL